MKLSRISSSEHSTQAIKLGLLMWNPLNDRLIRTRVAPSAVLLAPPQERDRERGRGSKAGEGEAQLARARLDEGSN